jgi:outer membrane autotransporter protein
LFADLSASFGVLDMTSRRQVADNMVDGGVNTAEASSLGRFLSPALTAGTHVALGEQVLTPSATLRYTQLDLDGYAESGATDDFAIDARTASELALRAQLALTLAPMLTEGGEIVWSFRAGADASRRDGMVTAMPLGEEISFEAGSAGDIFGALVGANLDYRIGESVNLSGDVEYTLDTAGSGTVTARASLSAAF